MAALQVARRTLLASICEWVLMIALGFVGILDPLGALAVGTCLIIPISASAVACVVIQVASWVGPKG